MVTTPPPVWSRLLELNTMLDYTRLTLNMTIGGTLLAPDADISTEYKGLAMTTLRLEAEDLRDAALHLAAYADEIADGLDTASAPQPSRTAASRRGRRKRGDR